MTEGISALVMPLAVAAVGSLLLFGKREYFDAFLRGAGRGVSTAISLLPPLVALTAAVGMLNASGAVTVLSQLLSPLTDAIGVPASLLPLLLTRPFSGSASAAAYTALLDEVGADSFPALCASVIYGASDTAVYVIALYFSSVGIRRTRYALPVSLTVMIFCIFFSCFLCRWCLT